MTEAPVPEAQPFNIEASQESVSQIKQALDSGGKQASDTRGYALRKLQQIRKKAEAKIDEGLEPADDRRIGAFLTELNTTDQPGIERRIVEHDIGKAENSEFENNSELSIAEMPETSGELLDGLIGQFETAGYTQPTDSEQRNTMLTVRDQLRDIKTHINNGDLDLLEIDYRGLQQLRHILGDANYYKVKIRVQREIRQLLRQKHTGRDGRVDERSLAHDLYSRGKQWGIDVRFGAENIQQEYNNAHADFVAGIQQQQKEQAYTEQQEGEKDFGHVSTFYLTKEEQQMLYSDNPLKFVERLIRKYEKVPLAHKSVVSQAAKQRFSLFISHIQSPDFIGRWARKSALYDEGRGYTVDAFAKDAAGMWKARTALHDFRNVIDEADFKAIIQQAAETGSGSWFKSILDNRSYIAFHRIEQKMEQARFLRDSNDPTHVRKNRITAEEITKMTAEVMQELKDEHELYASAGGFNSHEDVEAAVNTAMNLFVTSQRIAHHIAKSASPVDDPKGRHSYLTDPYDFVAGTFNVLDFHIDKWFTMTNNQQVVMGNVLKWITGDNDIEVARRKFGDMLQTYDVFSSGWRVNTMLDHLKEIAQIEYGEHWKEIYDSIALGVKLKKVAKGYRWGDIGGSSQEKRDNAKKELIGVWRQIARHRPQEMLKVFADNVRYKMKFDEKANNYVYKTEKVDGIKRRIVDSRYTNIAAAAIRELGLRNEDGSRMQNFDELQRYVGKYFNPINEMLANKRYELEVKPGERKTVRGLAAIDYTKSYMELKQEQQDVVDRVFQHFHKDADGNVHPGWKAARDNYFATMRKLAGFGLNEAGHEITIHEARDFLKGKGTRTRKLNVIGDLVDKPLYETMYTRIQFLDDARYWMAQEVPQSERGEQLVTPIVEKFSLLQGLGMKDMLPRAWGDMNVASQALQNLQTGMTTMDKEELMKAAKEMWNQIKQVEGVNEATAAVMYMVGGWLEAAKTDSLLSWTGLDKIPGVRGSDFQRKLGLTAPSMDISERREINEWLSSIGGNLKDVIHDKEIIDLFEKATSSSEARLTIFRTRTLILIMLFFMIQEMFREAQKTEQQNN